MIVLKPVFLWTLFIMVCFQAKGQSGNFKTYNQNEHELIFESDSDNKLRFQFYSENIIRVQWIKKGEDFFPKNHYETVVDHTLSGTYTIEDKTDAFEITVGQKKEMHIVLEKNPMRYKILSQDSVSPLLEENKGIVWENQKISNNFSVDTTEHFCGLGHQAYGMVESIDLKGKIVSSNYGEGRNDWSAQAVLTVPFYLSNKGYGIFLNSTFHHSFNFGKNNTYGFSIDTKGFNGQMDYFFIYGPEFKTIINNYTQLTGRPRLPQLSMFGLQLSDKGDPENDGMDWWTNKIKEHRKAGFPFDHIVNDNRWRAGSGAWAGSWFEWDSIRYPNPKAYNQWCKDNNVTMTLDLNRNTIADCEGWKPEYNLPQTEGVVKYPNSAPDYTNPNMRNWIWKMFWDKSFNPELNYPGDALWIDETDDLYELNDSVICANGRSWAENENYYPFLIAKGIVGEGWDNENNNIPEGIGESKRPFVWVRSTAAGAQRYASYWSGDIPSTCEFMKYSIRAMLNSGLGGFPYFNHDAGGFRQPGPDDNLYVQWAMGFGSLTPIWRPHGPGKNQRWPLDRDKTCQAAALKYGKMRYQMMPYIYTQAYNAYATGMPMARSMVIDYQSQPEAWKYDLQYMWGNELLIAPICSENDMTSEIWLPSGQDWYDYWTDNLVAGGQVIKHQSKIDETPIFIKQGAIIPEYPYAQSTFTLDPSILIIHVYVGKDGEFTLYEDDGVTEKFRTKNEKRTTKIIYQELGNKLTIYPSEGTYDDAISNRSYQIYFHGTDGIKKLRLNNKKLKLLSSHEKSTNNKDGVFWNEKDKTLGVFINPQSINQTLILK
ncbi:TIM-barrel domain-containing protein [Gaetbulibacter sp. M235]|uniref:glycoside hydrolase family 31 protein n=1 Tax=Gaetbulibacter sp. M235 TaxID=3126510 RepID=UPI00374F5313